jgi:formylglycine-generating enzyme required for sulfatase activity
MVDFRALAMLALVAVFGVPAARAQEAITNSLGMKLVRIPAGRFVMGSPTTEAERDPEEIEHEVHITKPFYLGAHEVTQSQFHSVVPKHKPHFVGSDLPIEQVTWRVAVEFCETLSNLEAERKAGRSYRLPTEAEWEYACRAGVKTAFHYGDDVSAAQANFNGNFPFGKAAKGPYLRKTAPVGSYAANAWGLFDMHGNVAEWCSDWYDPNYYKTSPKEDPPGPTQGVVDTGFNEFFRVVRGGCWHDEARACRSAYRFRLQPTEPYRLVGFRVVCVVK